ncbi:hypothetical protein AMS68_005208 [Peltaster fructicola]|uniref:MAPEG family protein n=1 Tax=Peltaster fructicola TaxID=286661 RepID=A0A6H0XYF4_9PEZI|nr:hypothetical protein AMS68_005208 [Peltaster fructicola]
MSTTYNFSLLSIPLYYILAVIPHGQAMAIASRGGGGRHDNRNPKSSDFIAKLKSKLSARDFARFERAESCHRNHFENMPLFVASVLASLFVERQTGVKLDTGLNAALILGTRVLYTLNYETQKWSYVRSMLYFISVGLCFRMILRAAKALGDE